jgi:hypothetical protein
MGIIPVWGPIQAVLDEFTSSDDVLRALRLAGFSGFDLSEKDNFSHTTRKRAYFNLADKKFSSSSEQERWRIAIAIAQDLAQREERHERLRVVLEAVGWKFDGAKFIGIAQPSHAQPVFFAAGEAHDAYVHIRDILQTARNDLLLIDPWAGGRIYGLIATVEGLKRCRILSGPRAQADFVREAEAFAKQYPAPSLEIRGSKEFHDRFAIVDGGNVYLFGASVEHAGERAFSVIPVASTDLARFVVEYAEKVWAAATVLFPKPQNEPVVRPATHA